MGAFHAYDIRGIFGEDIDINLTYKIARAAARLLPAEVFMIGYDARLHSHDMYKSVIKGLTDEGKNVIGIGLCSTPQLHFFQIKTGCGCGIMITASHNPPQYHGLKLFDAKGGSISYKKGLDKIEQMIHSLPPVKAVKGTYQEKSLEEDYIDFIISSAQGQKFGVRTVIDAANGSAGHVFKQVAERLDLSYNLINQEPDGNFPNHFPNPLLASSREQIAKKIKQNKADLGVVLDGDGDRIIFVDENGAAVENYFISALIAEELLHDNPGGAIVYDLISSKALPEHITACGGKAVLSRVGYTFIYDNMVATSALFGCETSGHVYFKVDDRYYTESAAYAFVVLLKLLEAKQKPLSQLVAPLRMRFYQAPELNLEVNDKQAVLSLIEKQYKDAAITKLDGISIEYPDFWFNVRPSNTEPVIRVRLEAISKECALAQFEKLKKCITSSI
ncbi:MAG: phosphomannomutase/phosphoglucomutase [Spirochaetales bacterium]|nr:phosphomannomutase/phosphoglucomutase [Spirochaetales bacterium]